MEGGGKFQRIYEICTVTKHYWECSFDLDLTLKRLVPKLLLSRQEFLKKSLAFIRKRWNGIQQIDSDLWKQYSTVECIFGLK